MALQRQPVTLSMVGGVDLKTDPYQVAGKLLLLENAVFISPKKLKKRPGYEPFGTGCGSSFIVQGVALAQFESELLMFDPANAYSYTPATNSWASRGPFVSVETATKPVIRNTYSQTAQDGAVHSSGLAAYAWEDSSGGVRYSVIDTTSGQVVVSNALVSAAGSRPKVVALGQYLLIFWVYNDTTTLYYSPIVVATPTVLGAAVPLTNLLVSDTAAYDVSIIGTRAYVAWGTSTGWSMLYLTPALSTSTRQDYEGAEAHLLTIFEDSHSQNVVMIWYGVSDLTAAVRYWIYSYDLQTTVDWGSIHNIDDVVSLTGASVPGPISKLRVFYTTSASSLSNYVTRIAEVENNVSTQRDPLRSAALAGTAFVYQGRVYVTVAHDSALQSTYFLVAADGAIVAKALQGVAGGVPTRPTLPEITKLSPTRFHLALLAQGQVGGSLLTPTGVNSVVFDMDADGSYQSIELGKNLIVSGGFPFMYDGVSFVEHGFHLFPEDVTAVNADADAGTTQSYQYAAVYVWIDNQGQTHYSAPSVPVTLQKLSKIDNSHRVTVTVPPLRLTAKKAVQIWIFRTEANGTVFYQANQASPLANNPTVDTLTFTDELTDDNLIKNLQLYTGGGVIENIAPPAIGPITIYRNRAVAVSSENRLQLWYSKVVRPGLPVEWNDSFVMNVSPSGGEVTAVFGLDDKLIIFKENSIFFSTGVGPDDTGNQNDLMDPQLVSTDAGCVDPNSIVLVPSGLMFKSGKGLYLLDRALQVSYVGADVEPYNSDRVTSAQLIPNTTQVRFTLDSGVALVFDYFVQQWSIFTPISAVDSVVYQGRFTYLRGDGQVRQETPGVFSDAGRPVKMRLKTGWLSLAGLQGYERAYSLYVLGQYLSAHKLVVRIAYDFDSIAAQENLVDAGSLLGNPLFGSDSPFGADVFGGTSLLYQWRIDFSRQKCEAFQVAIEDAPEDTGEAFSLSALGLLIGVKKGMAKMAPSRQFGR